MKKKIVGIFVMTLLIAWGTSASAFSIKYCNNNLFCNSNNLSVSLENPPPTFDLRDVNGSNYVSSVRDQNPHGTCWAHAIMASMESNLLVTGNWKISGETGEPDLSEAHIDWWNGFNTFNNDDVPGSDGLTPHWGSYCRMASAYFARGEGPVREIDAPYSEIDDPPERTNSNYHYYYVRDIECYDIGEDLGNIDLVKKKIMIHGALNICFCFNSLFLDENYCHYQPPNSDLELNHNVAIIGWDDNKVTPAPERGAWLCKNSWGSEWGLDGYFWISYYDKYCCHHHPDEWVASFQDVEPMSYKSIYYHDYHGWQYDFKISSEAFNSFTSMDDEFLTGVSFYTCTDNVDYEVRIYDRFENGELSGVLSSIFGTIDHMGFHTIDLDQPVYLKEGDFFYIYLELSDGGLPYDSTIHLDYWWSGDVTIESVSHPGESYYYDEGSWHDLYDLDSTANFCIKGLVSKTSDLECDDNINWGKVKPGSTVTHNIFITNVGEPFSKLNWEVSEWPDWGMWSFSPNKDYLYPESGAEIIQVSVVAPDEKNHEFTGEIKIVNKENSEDSCTIPVSLATPKNRATNPLFLQFLENFMQRFPLLAKLLQLPIFNKLMKS